MGSVDYTNGRYSYKDPAADPAAKAAAEKANYAKYAEEQRKGAQAVNDENQKHFDMDLHGGGGITWNNETFKPAEYSDWNANNAKNDTSPTGLNKTQQNWNSALDMTQGRGDATMNDPRVGAALDLLQQHTSEGPYTGAVVNQQANRMADRTSAMAGNQAEALRARAANSGGNVNDPSYQAAMNQADTGRMQQNNANRGDLESSATLNNYREQGNAAGQLGSMRMGQLGMANNQYNQAAQLYTSQKEQGSHVNNLGGGGGPTKDLGYKQPTYSPSDWSAIIDAINKNGGNNGGNSGDNTPAAQTQPTRPSSNQGQSQQPGNNASDYTGQAAQDWATANGGNQQQSQQPGNDASDYTGAAAQQWAANGKKLAVNLKPSTYNPYPGN